MVVLVLRRQSARSPPFPASATSSPRGSNATEFTCSVPSISGPSGAPVAVLHTRAPSRPPAASSAPVRSNAIVRALRRNPVVSRCGPCPGLNSVTEPSSATAA